ncbi:MAG: hypothetical protein PHX43_06675 [Alphaproteobacteria bacterium]|nr:hypothetical protein [Alphaproteobacteria bacterium]
MAKKHDKTGDHGKSHKEKNVEATDDSETQDGLGLFFSDDKKISARNFMRESYQRKCPPGLAKKRNGCLPPGQAKKYKVGGMLPSDYNSVPQKLLELLGPPPSGTFYSMVDDDVVLSSTKTRTILDAVTLLSAMK